MDRGRGGRLDSNLWTGKPSPHLLFGQASCAIGRAPVREERMRGANETVSNSITGATGLLPPIPETEPVFVPRLLPSTRCLWSEGKVLARLLYKVKNQHRSTLYYRKLQQVMRMHGWGQDYAYTLLGTMWLRLCGYYEI